MGGYGSGRHGGKRCTGDFRTLDVRSMQRDGQLRLGYELSLTWRRNGETSSSISIKVGSDCVTLAYSNRDCGGEWQPMNYPVRLDWTACNYGGQRAWWLCPVAGCGRRVAVLYSGAVFACRHCRQLAYQSQRESPKDRVARQANKLRARLGWKAGIFNPAGGRPKGMHWATYWRLKDSHSAHAQQILVGIYASWGRQPPRAHQA